MKQTDKSQPSANADHSTLKLHPGQTAEQFRFNNPHLSIFNAPFAFDTPNSIALDDFSIIVVDDPNLSQPLVFKAFKEKLGSAVVWFSSPKDGSEPVIQAVRFRPLYSKNDIDTTLAIAKQYGETIRARSDCTRIKLDGDDKGIAMIKQHGWDWPREALTPVLTNPSYYIQASEDISCNGVFVSFLINNGTLQGTSDYDVTIWVGELKPRGS